MSNTSEEYVFLKSGLAHTIAGFFTWAALLITCHQVSSWTSFFHDVIDFRYINIFVGIHALQNKDGSFEYYSSFQFMLLTLGLVFSFSQTTSMSTSTLSEIAMKLLSSTVSSLFVMSTSVEKATSWLRFAESRFVPPTMLP